MAFRTQAEWLLVLRKMLPGWFFNEEDNQLAHMQGAAAVLSTFEEQLDEHIRETFISQSTGDFLDAHGEERSVARLAGEMDAQYSIRVRNIRNQSNVPDIRSIVDSLLIAGTSTIVEDFDAALFMDRDVYMNRGALLISAIYNTFSIVVDKQLHPPYSFMDREYFGDREDFMGTSESSDYVFQLILEAVNNAKALGTAYRIIERLE